MKVLAVSVPAAGHLNPMLPLIRALLAQGDEVVVAGGAALEAPAREAGAGFRPAGHGEMDWFGALAGRMRGNPGDGLPAGRINHYFVPRLFGEVATADMIDDVLEVGRRVGPDLVLFETYALAGPLAADRLGVPGVHHLISPMLPHEVMELADDAVCPIWRSLGAQSPGYAGLYRGTTVQVAPPSLEELDLPGGQGIPLRPAPLPLGPAEPSSPPLVYLTLGTFFGGNAHVFRTVLEALAAEPVRLLVTVGAGNDPDSLGPVPGNARVERFVPQGQVMPGCSVVVHHGGSGTMFGALAHGLPQVVLPQGADNFANGELLVRAGVAVSLPPDQVVPERVRDAVHRALETPSFAVAGRRLAEEIAAMPDPAEVAARLRSLI